MSTRSKGRKNELRARDILVTEGYNVQMAPNPTRWAKQTDLFSLWDLMAIRKTDIRFVQVKTNQKRKETWEPMELWECPSNCSKEVWVFHDRVKEPSIYLL